MFKNILVVVLIAVAISGGWLLYQKYSDYDGVLSLLNATRQEVVYLHETIREDSLTISSMSSVIRSEREFNKKKSKELMVLQEKYDTLNDTYLRLQSMNDSLLQLNVVTYVDSLDSNINHYSTNFDLFKVYGTYGCKETPFINAFLKQVKPFVVEISIEKIKDDEEERIVFAKSNSLLLRLDEVHLHRIKTQESFLDKVYVGANLFTTRLGGGVSIGYDHFGLTYLYSLSGQDVLLNYQTKISDLW